MPDRKILFWTVTAFGAGAFLLCFVFGDEKIEKIFGIAVPLFVFLAFFREYRDDRKSENIREKISGGLAFDTAVHREKQIRYSMEHRFERPNAKGMEYDMLKRCRNFRSLLKFLLCLAFTLGEIFVIIKNFIKNFSDGGNSDKNLPVIVICVPFFMFATYIFFREYTGFAVKKWLRENADKFREFEFSYMGGQILSYKSDSVNLGREHIFVIKNGRLTVVDYNSVQSVTRLVERKKEYIEYIYTGDRYGHYAVIKVSDGSEIKVRLDCYQVGMFVEEYMRISGVFADKTDYSEISENDIIC